VNRTTKAVLSIAALAVPVGAAAMLAPADDGLCLASGATAYRLAPNAAVPDFRIRIDAGAAKPDLRIQAVDRAEIADFVLVDDGSGGPPSCRSAAVRTVAIDAAAAEPDVTVSLAATPAAADYRIFVRSARFSQRDAVALLAAIWRANQRSDVTGSIR
jgi:hypothetical protein